MRHRSFRRYGLVALTLALALLLLPAPDGIAKTKACKKGFVRNKAKRCVRKTTVKKATATTKPPTLGQVVTGGSGTGRDVDPNGILRYGTSLEVVLGIHFDPTQAPNITNNLWLKGVFGTLTRETPSGSFEPWMAKDVDIVDSKTVKISLRPGMRFTDGWPYDAQAVRDGLMRTRFQPASVAVQAGMGGTFREMQSAEVVDPLTVLIRLKSPVAGEFVGSLAEKEGAIVSPKQVADAPNRIDTAPVGAGPFIFDSYEPSQVLRLRKNKAFFDADKWRLGGIDFVHVLAGGPAVNGLLAGALDYVAVPADSRERVESDSRFGTASGFTETSPLWLNLCESKPPFDDVNVRRAFSLAIDRDQINRVIYGGKSVTATGWALESSPNYEPQTKALVRYDPEEAKRLLGGKQIDADIYVPGAGTGDNPKIMELVQGQVAKVGIKLTVSNSRDIVVEFIQPQKPGGYITSVTRLGADKYIRTFGAGNSANLCSTPRSDVITSVSAASAYGPKDPRRAESFRKAELSIAQNAYAVMLVSAPQFTAWTRARVGGTPAYGGGRGELIFDSIYMRK